MIASKNGTSPGNPPRSPLGSLRARRVVCGGFTLVEIIVATAVFALMLAILVSIITHTSDLTRRAGERISTFQNARAAFDLLASRLSQATLNTYWDYDNPQAPRWYLRQSELHFVTGPAGAQGLPGTPGTGQAVFFQVPLGISVAQEIRGLPDLLNACGYFVEYGETDVLPPPFPQPPATYRYQLMQSLEIAEDLEVYASDTGRDWIAGLAEAAVPVADNVIFLSIWPRLSAAEGAVGNELTTDFTYDSRLNADVVDNQGGQLLTAHQMPPLLQVTMVVMDEQSAVRFCTDASPPAAIEDALAGLFQQATVQRFEEDLETMEANLTDLGVNFRVFSAMVAVRESKMQ